jgi:hypothetical protein
LHETSVWPYICDQWQADSRNNQPRRKKKRHGGSTMKTVPVSRRVLLKSSKATAAWLIFSPAIIGRAQAATMKLKCSSSLPNDPK